MEDKKIEEHFRKGTFKSNMTRIKHIMSRALGPDGKLYSGEAGSRLRKKQRAKADYYKRNQ